jgi:hypothetical protein
MNTMPKFPGWHLLGAFPDGAPDDVGSWLLHFGDEAMLLEVPPGLSARVIRDGLNHVGATRLKYITVSHDHEDHMNSHAWFSIGKAFPRAHQLNPRWIDEDKLLILGGEPIWLIRVPKHSFTDTVTIFRGVAMTGDIELGQLESVNDEVPEETKRNSMEWLRDFPDRTGYRVHSIMSAHLNDVRTSVDWQSLFTVEPVGVPE